MTERLVHHRTLSPKNNPGLSVSVLFAATAWDPVPPMPQAMPAEIITSCISFL